MKTNRGSMEPTEILIVCGIVLVIMILLFGAIATGVDNRNLREKQRNWYTEHGYVQVKHPSFEEVWVRIEDIPKLNAVPRIEK